MSENDLNTKEATCQTELIESWCTVIASAYCDICDGEKELNEWNAGPALAQYLYGEKWRIINRNGNYLLVCKECLEKHSKWKALAVTGINS